MIENDVDKEKNKNTVKLERIYLIRFTIFLIIGMSIVLLKFILS